VPQPEDSIAEWGKGMIAFNKKVLDSLPGRLDPNKHYRIYIEHPEGVRAEGLIGLEHTALESLFTTSKINNVEIITFTPRERRAKFNDIIRSAAKDKNVSIATFALKPTEESTEDQKLRSDMEQGSYTFYMGVEPEVGYVPVTTCVATGIKTFNYKDIEKANKEKGARVTASDIRDQNTALELIARGVLLLCDANSVEDIIESISTLGVGGLRELFGSGRITVVIRRVDINKIGELNRMAKAVKESV